MEIKELMSEACFWASYSMVGLYDALETKKWFIYKRFEKNALYLFNEANSLSEKCLAKASSEDGHMLLLKDLYSKAMKKRRAFSLCKLANIRR